jgi:hypothetical protein
VWVILILVRLAKRLARRAFAPETAEPPPAV